MEPFPAAAQRQQRARFFNLFTTLSLLATLVGCRVRPPAFSAPGKLEPGTKSQCSNGATLLVGAYRYENNQWGHDKARGGYEQCLLTRERNGQREYGWTWDWPGEDRSVFAYPEIIWGWKPWSGGASTDVRFPRRVADVARLAIHYSVEMDASGSYNLAPEIWLTRRKGGGSPNPKLITTEIMFWLDYAGIARPAGDIIEQPTIDGVPYELWKMDNIGDSGGGVGWRIYTLKRLTPVHAGTLNVHEILRYMSEKRQINPNDFVASVELGNEIVGGRGTTWVRRFEVEALP